MPPNPLVVDGRKMVVNDMSELDYRIMLRWCVSRPVGEPQITRIGEQCWNIWNR